MKKCFLWMLLLFTPMMAESPSQSAVLKVHTAASQDKIVSGQEFYLAIVLNIAPGLHINSDQPLGEFFIPTKVTFESQTGFSFGMPIFPQAAMKLFSFSEDKLSIFEGETVIVVPISTSPDLELSEKVIKGHVSYQGCTDTMCFAPEEMNFEITLPVVAEGTTIQLMNQDYFHQLDSDQTMRVESLTQQERDALSYLEKGLVTALLAFFVIGLALNLTPCVYPVIPLTVSYFGGRSNQTKGSAFIDAIFYQLGIAISFAVLGLISGLAGRQWGFLFQSPWFVVVIVTIMLLMAASLFGAFEISVPSWLLTRVSKTKQGSIGALIMGLTAGVVIAPCAAGIIIGLVGLIAKLGLVVKGTLLFFVMGLGLGLPYLILASFSGLLNKLPQSGEWMIWIKKIFAFMLIGVALYFVLPQLEQLAGKLGFLLGIMGLTAGLLLGFIEHGIYSRAFNVVRKGLGVLLIILGLVWIHNGIHAQKSEISWIHFENQTLDTLLAEGKPVFIDFYADWCAPCKQLDAVTFTDAEVNKLSSSMSMVKVDCTKPNDTVKAFMEQFQVTGMPTLIFISKSGVIQEDLREIGFIPPTKFIKSMEKTISAD